ncbi:MAG: arginine--tRNA ligase [Firmicutes bacterium]|nr:arginine--tRNA ligase [Bacillota bacterium]MDY2719735.1 arginine--tRNA ligase [Candidatus Faecousia sp.]
MQKILDQISAEVASAFEQAGYDPAYGKVTVSNRPDLCEYQCNGSLPAAKCYHKPPMAIAGDVAEKLKESALFSSVEAAAPGFLNLKLSASFLASYLEAMRTTEKFGLPTEPTPKTVVIDYGGPNVAKPLHIGHLRSAIIGESIKRISKYFGNHVIGDIHMGDWGLQMGLIIAELQQRQPELCYFDDSYTGSYPDEPPFTISTLEEIYPTASAKSKVDEDFAKKAHDATYALQHGKPGYRALWKHIMTLSVADLKKNYDNLNVSFESWLGESDAQPYIQPMLERMQAQGIITESEGAKVVQVQEPTDAKEVPPCILVKSDGATLYATTDLATMVQRQQDFHPDEILYVVDKRQSLYFEQLFRVARKAAIVPPQTKLQHIGFGTMNGKDGKPFKTREGGVMRLEQLIREITDFVRAKVEDNQLVPAQQVEETTRRIAMAALKYGDLSNQPTKDYIFDLDRFAAFEGNTGPYILYTIVRIKSILEKYGGSTDLPIQPPVTQEEKDLMLAITRFADSLQTAYRDAAPNVICAYIYELSGFANKFYHETRILAEEDALRQQGYIALIALTKSILETCIDLLGFSAPERM